MEVEKCPAMARRLADARDARGKTQIEVAREMGISSASLSVLERNGTIGVTRFVDVLAVCQYYGWSLDEVAALCFGTQAPDQTAVLETTLAYRALSDEQRDIVTKAVRAMVAGLVKEGAR